MRATRIVYMILERWWYDSLERFKVFPGVVRGEARCGADTRSV